jgi:hypothetical protein
MPDDPAPDFNRVGFGAGGDVHVQHDASQHQHVHNEDKSQHTHFYHPPGIPPVQPTPPAHTQNALLIWTFAVILIVAGGFLSYAVLSKPSTSSTPPTPPTNPNPVSESQRNVNLPLLPPPISLPTQESSTTEPPQIIAAETGKFNITFGTFTPTATFQTGDLLTLKVRISRDAYLRVLYQPAIGDPQLLFPEHGDGSALVPGGRDVFLPDPAKLAAQTADASAFQLFHDFGTGPPLDEQLIIQVSPTPLTDEGSQHENNRPYRVYSGLQLADARTRGGIRLSAQQAITAQRESDSKNPAPSIERNLTFSIHP